MVVSGRTFAIVHCMITCLLLVVESNGLNIGLIAGNTRRPSNPLIVKKISRNTPVFININSKSGPLSIPKLSPKPPETLKLPRSIIPPVLPPFIPKLPRPPLIPLFPPLLPLPPFLPHLPLLPLPLIPRLPRLSKLRRLINPLRVPILGKPLLQKVLGSERKLIKVPIIKVNKKGDILEKLLKLKKQGSLTTAEFIRFRKLLLK